MFRSAKMSASLPSTNFLSIMFFVDSFVKAFISPSTFMQLAPEQKVVLIGFFMTMVGFWAAAYNAYTATTHLKNVPTVASEQDQLLPPSSGASLPDEENGILPPPSTDSSLNNNPDGHIPTKPQTAAEKVCDRAGRVRSYFFPETVSPQESRSNGVSTAPRPVGK
jgi:hypothetical protein